MKLALVLFLLVLATACGTDTADTALDPAGTPSSTGTPGGGATSRIPPAVHGEVTTRMLATVMDTGRPELCLGPVAESYPPQCSGIPLRGWDWAEHEHQFERSGDVRWGLFAVTGTFDGTTMTVTGAVPAAAYDPAGPPGEPGPTGDAGLAGPQQQEIQRKVEAHPFAGTLSVYATPGGIVAEVIHDDGSLQEQADAAYGSGVVAVRSMLVPVND